MKNSLKKIKTTIDKYNMFSENDRILVAFSGGCDSVCLALALHNLGYTIGLAHVNHGIRETASRDEDFCNAFAKRLNVPIFVSHPDVLDYAKKNKISTETAGRILRYEFFNSFKDYNLIATAHHKNDLAETVVQHLIRGTGSKGLTGILPVRDNIVRPLIDLEREEIEDLLTELNEIWCTDETNFSEEYGRNRVRLNILPLLTKENEKAIDNISKTARILKADDDYLTNEAVKLIENDKISIERLKNAPLPLSARALMVMYSKVAGTSKDFEYKHIEYILNNLKEHGEILNLCFGVKAVAEYGNLVFSKDIDDIKFCYPVKINGKTYLPEAKKVVCTLVCDEKPSDGIYFDFEKVKDIPLYVRTPRADDYFIPFGMDGGKPLNKVMIDLKIPKHERTNYPLLTTDKEILWIFDKKRGNGFACDEFTKKYLKFWEENTYES